MAAIETRPLSDAHPFGVRLNGVTRENLKDENVREQIIDVFNDRGLIVFENVEPSTELQVELSNVFGPLEDHPLASNKRVDGENLPGVIDMHMRPENATVIQLEGEHVSGWTPWHFDSAYTKELCRAGVLRPVIIAPEGGLTGFVDGIELYTAISPTLRANFEDAQIIYDPHLLLTNLRFGMPKNWGYVRLGQSQSTLDVTKDKPRSVHPAILAASVRRTCSARLLAECCRNYWPRELPRRFITRISVRGNESKNETLLAQMGTDGHAYLG